MQGAGLEPAKALSHMVLSIAGRCFLMPLRPLGYPCLRLIRNELL